LVSRRQPSDAVEPIDVLGFAFDLHGCRRLYVRGALVGAESVMKNPIAAFIVVALCSPATAGASGHGPVFGAATPTLGRGGWSVDQAWTLRAGDDEQRQQMLKTMLSFGITENLQLSGSFPLAMSDGSLTPARMMSAMSSDREFEAL